MTYLHFRALRHSFPGSHTVIVSAILKFVVKGPSPCEVAKWRCLPRGIQNWKIGTQCPKFSLKIPRKIPLKQ